MKQEYKYDATVVRVVDGDTLALRVDLGFHVTTEISVRVLGINAPELKTAEGRAVRDYVKGMLSPGSAVTIQTFRDPGDKYGRWLAHVDVPGVGDLGDHLISKGMAVPFMVG